MSSPLSNDPQRLGAGGLTQSSGHSGSYRLRGEGEGRDTWPLCLSLTFSPLAPASPRRPGSPGGPCRETESHSFQGVNPSSSPPLPTSSELQLDAPCPRPPHQSITTHHRSWRSSLACGSRTTLLALQIGGTTEVRKSVPIPYSSLASHPPNPASPHQDSPLSLGAPSDHQDQVFLLGLQDPQGLSFPGHPQHQHRPETHIRNVS